MDGDGCSAQCIREVDFACATLLLAPAPVESEMVLPTVFEWLNNSIVDEALAFQVVPLGPVMPGSLGNFAGNTDGEEFVIQLSFVTPTV